MSKNHQFRVACIQMTTGTKISENLSILETRFQEAKEKGADFIVTPEQSLLMAENKASLFENISYEDEDFGLRKLRGIVKKVGLFVIVGSISIKYNEDLALNRTYAFNPDGDIIGVYDKIHMFDVTLSDGEKYHESKIYKPGKKLSLVSLPWCDVGLTICYDLRFPELYRKLAQKGASVIIVPSAFTVTTGEAHWHVLNRARAIENGAFVISACATGSIDGGGECYGHSLVIDPWGNVLADGGVGSRVVSAKINLADVKDTREKNPSLNHDRDFKLKIIDATKEI